jgi:thymidylate synthase ThyX
MNNQKVTSQDGLVSARVVLASRVEWLPTQITTMELEYPRIIHSEFMTHRMFSRNAASSRAIPFYKMKEQLEARPVRFGQANKGMQDKGEDYDGRVNVW